MSRIPRTVCPYCNLGCELGFELKGVDVRRVEYVKDSRNQGRLCARGNAAVNVINHRRRLYHAVLDGASASLAQGIAHLEKRLSEFKPDEVLLLYDASLTVEETDALAGWAAAAGFKNLAYVTVGPESAFLYGNVPAVSPERIAASGYAFILGDAFSQDSVISGYIGKAKAGRRDFRYIVADCITTNTSRFAHVFVRLKPGYEGLFVYGLYRHITAKKADLQALAEALDIESSTFETVAAVMRNKEGVLVNAAVRGWSLDPFLTHTSSLLLAEALEGMTYIPLGPRPPERVARPFFSYLPMLMAGRIKAVVSLGVSFPWDYPQLWPALRKADFVAAGSLFIPEARFKPELVLPMASEFEKAGTVRTLFGETKLSKAVPEVSGTLPAGEYVRRFGKAGKPDEPLAVGHDAIDEAALTQRVENLLALKPRRKKGMKHVLVGAESAIGFGGMFETENWVKLNPADAALLGVRNGDEIGVETEQAGVTLEARVLRDVPSGIAVVSLNHPPSVALFELGTDPPTGEGLLKPSWSRIWKK